MKNFLIILKFTLLIAISVSCNKKEFYNFETSTDLTNLSINDQRKWIKQNLLNLSTDIGKLAMSEFGRKLVKYQAQKMKDGEPNALIADIADNLPDSLSEMRSSLKTKLKVFESRKELNLNPHVYIPRLINEKPINEIIQTFSNDNSSLSETNPENLPPYFVFFDGDDEVTHLPAYTFNEDIN